MVACRYGISLLVFNSTSHSFAALTLELSCLILEEKFHIYARPCIILYLSHKLRCYTRISGPKKSRNNIREKISYFFTCVDIAKQLLTRHSPLAPLGQVDERTGKAFTILNTSCLSELSRIIAAKTLKPPYRWQTMRFKLS